MTCPMAPVASSSRRGIMRRSSLDSSSSDGSSGRRSSLQRLARDEADPLMALGLGGVGGSLRQERKQQGPSTRGRAGRKDDAVLQPKRSSSLSQKAFRVHRERISAPHRPPQKTSLSPPRTFGGNRSRLASADAALPQRRRSYETAGTSATSMASSMLQSLNDSSSTLRASGSSPADADGDISGEDGAALKEIARLRTLLAHSQTELESTKAKLTKYSKENKSLRRRVAGYKTELDVKDERLNALECEVESLRRGVTDANEMERANRRMEEEQLRLEGRRLREERDRAILERNELMSRVGMMGVEVDEEDDHHHHHHDASAPAVDGEVGGGAKRRNSITDIIQKMGGTKIGSDLAMSMNASCGKIVVTPESLLWDSDDS